MSSEYAVEVKELVKKFGTFTAVDRISFNVKKGTIFGFLGANGAGKSTTIRILCGLLEPTSGTAIVGGYDVRRNPEEVKKIIGYMSQKFSLYESLTVEENINFFGGVYGLSKLQLEKTKDWLLELAGLRGREKNLTGTLSTGWKQRLALGCAILHQPAIVFLDEPTGGVDPVSRRQFWALINDLAEDGMTVFITTHYLDETEFCNDIRLIHAGQIIAGGSPFDLKKKYLGYSILEVDVSQPVLAMEILEKYSWVRGTAIFGRLIHVNVESEAEARRLIPEILAKSGINVRKIDRVNPSIEDVFISEIESSQVSGEKRL